jgi:hypothetical protein
MVVFRDIESKVDAAKALLRRSGFGKLTNPFAADGNLTDLIFTRPAAAGGLGLLS